MTAIIVSVILAFLLQLAIWESVVLGAAWIVGKLADISVNYLLIGGIVLGIWIVVLAVKVLFIYGAYRVEKQANAEFETSLEDLRKKIR